jgi:hypothetical protein
MQQNQHGSSHLKNSGMQNIPASNLKGGSGMNLDGQSRSNSQEVKNDHSNRRGNSSNGNARSGSQQTKSKINFQSSAQYNINSKSNNQTTGSTELAKIIRPSSRSRQAPPLNQPNQSLNNTQKYTSSNPNVKGQIGVRGMSPSLNNVGSGGSQINVGITNLHSYFESQLPAYQSTQNKTLPRKKRMPIADKMHQEPGISQSYST